MKVAHSNLLFLLPLMDSPDGLPKLKFVEPTVFEIMGGGGGGGGQPHLPS